MHRSVFKKDLPWQYIRSKVGRRVQEEHEPALTRLLNWWENNYKKDSRVGLVELEASVAVGDSVVTDTIPLVLAKEDGSSVLVVLCDEFRPNEILYNDFVLRSYLWLASEYLSSIIDSIELVNFSYWSPSVKMMRVQKGNDSMKGHVQRIVQAIERNFIYPSQTAMCQQCHFKSECWL